jgi:hypothetical protein
VDVVFAFGCERCVDGREATDLLHRVGATWADLPVCGGWAVVRAADQLLYTAGSLGYGAGVRRGTDHACGASGRSELSALPRHAGRGGASCGAQSVRGAAVCTGRDWVQNLPRRSGGASCEAWEGAVVNPDKLDAARRDSACTQCHLEGETVVYRAGRSLSQFRAGEDLAGTAVFFVGGRGEASDQPV